MKNYGKISNLLILNVPILNFIMFVVFFCLKFNLNIKLQTDLNKKKTYFFKFNVFMDLFYFFLQVFIHLIITLITKTDLVKNI